MKFFPLLLLLSLACSSVQEKKEKKEAKVSEAPIEVEVEDITHEKFSRLIETWPEDSKAAANSMLVKYGLPHGLTDSLIIWENTAPFSQTKVHRRELTHNFPNPHNDVIEQVIDYKVPSSKVDDLWKFDGSIVLDRTKGVMSSRSEKEEMNILALNLADEIVKGKMSVEEARLEYARSAHAFLMGNTNQYINSLNFIPPSETADADMAIDLKGRPAMRPNMEAQEDTKLMQEAQEALESEFED